MRRDPVLKKRSRDLRRNLTPAETILWRHLRGRRFAQFKFRRQQVVGPFVVDFYCAARSLVIELDGDTHVGQERQDEARQAWLEARGLKVLRCWNTEVYENLDGLLAAIWLECERPEGR